MRRAEGIADRAGKERNWCSCTINAQPLLALLVTTLVSAAQTPSGNLIANAPHMPVHLGSMGESIKTVVRENASTMQPGDVYVLNDPYHGGTHLPDITVIILSPIEPRCTGICGALAIRLPSE